MKSFSLSYPAEQMGYPLEIVPTDEGRFAYIEYWTGGEGRKTPNYYLQEYNNLFEENWFKPVTKAGAPKMEVEHLIKLDKSIVVTGTQYQAGLKRNSTKAQFFSLEGSPKGSLAQLSNFTKKAKKGFLEFLEVSPDRSKLLWMGHNPGAAAKKRKHFLSVWNSDGRPAWSKELLLPHIEKGYFVTEAKVDDRGNAYFLLCYEKVSFSSKDTLNLPIVLRYDYKSGEFSSYQTNAKGSSIPEIHLHLNQKGKLVLLAILSDGSDSGIQNGLKSKGFALTWNKIAYKQFEVERTLKLTQENTMDIPSSWVEAYQKEGAEFSLTQLQEHQGKLFWIMEEFYLYDYNGTPQHRYYDVAVVSIDMEAGNMLWATHFDKDQRDYLNGNLLSYTCGFANGKLHFVYLNERGAQGKVLCKSINIADGSQGETVLAKNDMAQNLFFPNRSTMTSEGEMVLMGIGNPVKDDYKLIKISF